MAMRRPSQASGRHAAIGRGLPFAAKSSGGGDVRLDRRPCRKAMRPPMIARLLIGLKISRAGCAQPRNMEVKLHRARDSREGKGR